MARFFISYSRVDSVFTEAFENLLRKDLAPAPDHYAWYDQHLTGGQKWWNEILSQIAQCDVFIYLLSNESVQSEYCQAEFKEAQRLQKYIFTVQVRDRTKLEGDLSDIQYVDMTLGLENGVAVAKLARAINYALNNSLAKTLLPLSETKTPRPDIKAETRAADAPQVTTPPLKMGEPTPKPATPPTKFDIHEAIDRYDAAIDAEQWYDARSILEDIRDSNQTAPGFNPKPEWDKLTEIITKLETDAARAKGYGLIQRRYPRLSMDELKDALNDFWQTYPDYDPSYLVKPRPHVWIKIPAEKVTLIEEWMNKSYIGAKSETKTFDVPAFQIGKYPVTVAQYDEFIQDRGYTADRWWKDLAQRFDEPQELPAFSRPDHPRVNITWFEAIAYCRWLSKKLSQEITLPTDQQWQRAAQGDDNRKYPWGEWKKECCNIRESSICSTTRVNQYEGKGDSFYQVVDMTGNVWEWCLTAYQTDKTAVDGMDARVLRGGSWANIQNDFFRTNCRFGYLPQYASDFRGFRVVLNNGGVNRKRKFR